MKHEAMDVKKEEDHKNWWTADSEDIANFACSAVVLKCWFLIETSQIPDVLPSPGTWRLKTETKPVAALHRH